MVEEKLKVARVTPGLCVVDVEDSLRRLLCSPLLIVAVVEETSFSDLVL